MKLPDSALERLLRSAAEAPQDNEPTAPFGFETRVVALWRAANGTNGGNGILRLVRQVAVLASAIILFASVASIRELQEAADAAEPTENEYAIADSAIQTEFYQ